MGEALKINAYFTQHQPETQRLRVIAQDQPSVNLLRKQNPKYHTKFSVVDVVLFKFKRSEKMFTLLRLLGVKEEFQ